jgi:ketosteroid isomerase-like protein
MSEENVEIGRSIYEAVNRRDWDAAFRDQAPDVEYRLPRGDPPRERIGDGRNFGASGRKCRRLSG